MDNAPEHTLEYLLDFDGRVHWLEQGYWLKFEIKRVEPTVQRPHGLSYSFTLHDPDGKRLIGFDNAHTVKPLGGRYGKRPETADHWHRTRDDAGRPYQFTSAEQLLEDFFAEVSRVLAERGVSDSVVAVDEKGGP
jgi:hypothetical protein